MSTDTQLPELEFEGPMGKFWGLDEVSDEALSKAVLDIHKELSRRRTVANSKESKLKLCIGCNNNFYNGNNELGVKECWSLKTAKVVLKKQVGMNDVPPWTHQPVLKVLSCCHIKGYVLVDPKAVY